MRTSLPLRTYVVLLLFSCFLYLLDRMALLDAPKRFAQAATVPLQQAVADTVAKIQRMAGGLTTMWWAQKRYDALSIQYNLLLAQQSRLTQLEEENRKLYAQLGSIITKQRKLLPARLLGRSPDIFIDKGNVDNVTEGMVVVLGDVLIGRVSDVGPRRSRVQLLSDSESKVMVEVIETHQKGLVQGRFNIGMRLTKILQGVPLQEDRMLITTGEDGVFPSGLSIGKITRVQRQESDLFQEADVMSMVQLDQVYLVFIVIE